MRHFLCILLLAVSACGGGGGASQDETVAFYGDSITNGTYSANRDVWTPVRLSPTPVDHIAGIAGVKALDYSYNGASIADAKIANDASSLVVLRFGVADTVRAMPAEAFKPHVTRLVEEARGLGKDVLITGLTHTAAYDTSVLDNVLRERAVALNVRFVDVYALPFSVNDLADTIHPAESYSRMVGRTVAAQI